MENNENKLVEAPKQQLTLGNVANYTIDRVNALLQKGSISFPQGYDFGTAVTYAVNAIRQDSNIASCNIASVGQALMDMITLGLDARKKQGYFINYGGVCKFQPSYFGDAAALLNAGIIVDIDAQPIFKGDDLELKTINDRVVVKSYKTKFGNSNNEIIGGYAWVKLPNGEKRYCIMTMQEIEKSWAKSRNNKNAVQKDFATEMVKRTLIRRLVKLINNTSANTMEGRTAFVEAFNRVYDDEFDNGNAPVKEEKTTVKIDDIFEADETTGEVKLEENNQE